MDGGKEYFHFEHYSLWLDIWIHDGLMLCSYIMHLKKQNHICIVTEQYKLHASVVLFGIENLTVTTFEILSY